MRSLVLAGLCLSAVALAPLTARADAAEAEQLRSDITAGIYEMLAGPEQPITFGAVEVVGAAAPYDVTIRGIKFNPDPESRADVGDITFKLAPVSEGVYEVSDLKLPSSVALLDGSGVSQGTVALGSQSFKGVWSKPLQSFLSMDGSFGDLKVTDETGKEVVSLTGLTVKSDSKETTPSHWDQDAVFTLSGLKGGDEEAKVSIGEIEVSSQVRALDMAAFESLKKQIEAITEEAAKAQAPMPVEPDGGIGTTPPSDDGGQAAPSDDTGQAAPSDDGTQATPSDDTGSGSNDAVGENKLPPENEPGQADTGEATGQEGTGQEAPGQEDMSQDGTGQDDTGTTDQGDMTIGPDATSPAEAEAAAKMLQTLSELPALLGDTISQITVRDLVVQDGTGKELLSLGEGGLDLGLTGLDKERSGFRFAYRHTALKGDWAKLDHSESEFSEPVDPQEQEKQRQLVDALVPSDLVIDIRLEDLPGKELWQSFLQTVGSEAASPAIPGAAPDIASASAFFGMTAVGTLQKAGSRIRVVDSKFISKVTSLAIDGQFQAAATAPVGATGQLNLEIVGLDDLIQLVKTNITGPQAAEQTAPLELLRAFSERGDKDGHPVDRYVLSLDPNGALLLNGKDMQFLMNAMSGQQPDMEQPMPEPGQEQPMPEPGQEQPDDQGGAQPEQPSDGTQ
jgi:hypothetical protein